MLEGERDDFDSPWKEGLEEWLEDFFSLFFPAVHAAIDWGRPHEFLNAELQRVVRDAELGRRLADKLVRVWRRDGARTRVLIHVEVQSQRETAFPERMFVYSYRIFDRHHRHPISLALLADPGKRWRPSRYDFSEWGCSLRFRFPIAKLADWRARRAELEASDNPFATVALAHLAAQDTRRSVARREMAKLALIRRLYERGYGRERVLSLFRFIDWLLALPPTAERRILDRVQRIEEERQMRYITSAERIGREDGLKQGLQEGRQEAKRDAVRRLVQLRFGAIPAALEERIDAAGAETLDQLFDRAATVQTVDDL